MLAAASPSLRRATLPLPLSRTWHGRLLNDGLPLLRIRLAVAALATSAAAVGAGPCTADSVAWGCVIGSVLVEEDGSLWSGNSCHHSGGQ